MTHKTSILTAYIAREAAKRFLSLDPDRRAHRFYVPSLLPGDPDSPQHGGLTKGMALTIRRAWRYIACLQDRNAEPFTWTTAPSLTGGVVVTVTIPKSAHQDWVQQEHSKRLGPGWTESVLAAACDQVLMWALHETHLNTYRAQVMDLADVVKKGMLGEALQEASEIAFREAAEAEAKRSGRSADPRDWDYNDCMAWLDWLRQYQLVGGQR